MVTIGVDPHKQTHTAAAVNELGVQVAQPTAPARPLGNGQLLQWARTLDHERVWAVEDVRNVSGSLERFLIDRGEYMLAIIRIRDDPRTAIYVAKQRATGKTKHEAIRNLKRHLARRVYHLLHDPNRLPATISLMS